MTDRIPPRVDAPAPLPGSGHRIPPTSDHRSPPPPPAAPATLDVATSGLDPDQEIRARAAAIVTPHMPGAAWADVEQALDRLAAYIRDGSRP